MWAALALSFASVRPIFQARCVRCHESLSVEKVAYDARARIADKVKSRQMPPGNVTGMTEDERKRVVDWARGLRQHLNSPYNPSRSLYKRLSPPKPLPTPKTHESPV